MPNPGADDDPVDNAIVAYSSQDAGPRLVYWHEDNTACIEGCDCMLV